MPDAGAPADKKKFPILLIVAAVVLVGVILALVFL
jgi:flagellar basal body-associated protein FliL